MTQGREGSHYGVCHQAADNWGPLGGPELFVHHWVALPSMSTHWHFWSALYLAEHTSVARERAQAESLAYFKTKKVSKQHGAYAVGALGPHLSWLAEAASPLCQAEDRTQCPSL